MSKVEEIKKLYYNPRYGLANPRKLYEKLKEKGISLKEIKKFVRVKKLVNYIATNPKEKISGILSQLLAIVNKLI